MGACRAIRAGTEGDDGRTAPRSAAGPARGGVHGKRPRNAAAGRSIPRQLTPDMQSSDPADPRHRDTFRRALALFAAGAWHAAHEAFEELWRGYGRRSAEGQLLQALVQLCASELKRCAGGRAEARLAARAAGHLDGLPGVVLGVRTPELAARIRSPERPVRIPLEHALDAPGVLG